mmetsp:Transcript_19343/g.61988  ORF Transcript_19343/g.61988 Transcript_19343/m.61988 type:complete len:301 (-) Transcript_19343:1174-2076(-)
MLRWRPPSFSTPSSASCWNSSFWPPRLASQASRRRLRSAKRPTKLASKRPRKTIATTMTTTTTMKATSRAMAARVATRMTRNRSTGSTSTMRTHARCTFSPASRSRSFRILTKRASTFSSRPCARLLTRRRTAFCKSVATKFSSRSASTSLNGSGRCGTSSSTSFARRFFPLPRTARLLVSRRWCTSSVRSTRALLTSCARSLPMCSVRSFSAPRNQTPRRGRQVTFSSWPLPRRSRPALVATETKLTAFASFSRCSWQVWQARRRTCAVPPSTASLGSLRSTASMRNFRTTLSRLAKER